MRKRTERSIPDLGYCLSLEKRIRDVPKGCRQVGERVSAEGRSKNQFRAKKISNALIRRKNTTAVELAFFDQRISTTGNVTESSKLAGGRVPQP